MRNFVLQSFLHNPLNNPRLVYKKTPEKVKVTAEGKLDLHDISITDPILRDPEGLKALVEEAHQKTRYQLYDKITYAGGLGSISKFFGGHKDLRQAFEDLIAPLAVLKQEHLTKLENVDTKCFNDLIVYLNDTVLSQLNAVLGTEFIEFDSIHFPRHQSTLPLPPNMTRVMGGLDPKKLHQAITEQTETEIDNVKPGERISDFDKISKPFLSHLNNLDLDWKGVWGNNKFSNQEGKIRSKWGEICAEPLVQEALLDCNQEDIFINILYKWARALPNGNVKDKNAEELIDQLEAKKNELVDNFKESIVQENAALKKLHQDFSTIFTNLGLSLDISSLDPEYAKFFTDSLDPLSSVSAAHEASKRMAEAKTAYFALIKTQLEAHKTTLLAKHQKLLTDDFPADMTAAQKKTVVDNLTKTTQREVDALNALSLSDPPTTSDLKKYADVLTDFAAELTEVETITKPILVKAASSKSEIDHLKTQLSDLETKIKQNQNALKNTLSKISKTLSKISPVPVELKDATTKITELKAELDSIDLSKPDEAKKTLTKILKYFKGKPWTGLNSLKIKSAVALKKQITALQKEVGQLKSSVEQLQKDLRKTSTTKRKIKKSKSRSPSGRKVSGRGSGGSREVASRTATTVDAKAHAALLKKAETDLATRETLRNKFVAADGTVTFPDSYTYLSTRLDHLFSAAKLKITHNGETYFVQKHPSDPKIYYKRNADDTGFISDPLAAGKNRRVTGLKRAIVKTGMTVEEIGAGGSPVSLASPSGGLSLSPSGASSSTPAASPDINLPATPEGIEAVEYTPADAERSFSSYSDHALAALKAKKNISDRDLAQVSDAFKVELDEEGRRLPDSQTLTLNKTMALMAAGPRTTHYKLKDVTLKLPSGKKFTTRIDFKFKRTDAKYLWLAGDQTAGGEAKQFHDLLRAISFDKYFNEKSFQDTANKGAETISPTEIKKRLEKALAYTFAHENKSFEFAQLCLKGEYPHVNVMGLISQEARVSDLIMALNTAKSKSRNNLIEEEDFGIPEGAGFTDKDAAHEGWNKIFNIDDRSKTELHALATRIAGKNPSAAQQSLNLIDYVRREILKGSW